MRTEYINTNSLPVRDHVNNILQLVKSLLNPNAPDGTNTIAWEFADNRTLYVAYISTNHIAFELSNTVLNDITNQFKLGVFVNHSSPIAPMGANIWHLNTTSFRAIIINQKHPAPFDENKVNISIPFPVGKPASTGASLLFLYDKVNDIFYVLGNFYDTEFRKIHYWQGLTYQGIPRITTCQIIDERKNIIDNNILAADLTVNGVNFTTEYRISYFTDLNGTETHRENSTHHAIVLGNMSPFSSNPTLPAEARPWVLHGLVLEKAFWDV